MSDGSWGYTAEQGLKAVLGEDNIEKMNRREEAMSPAEMKAYIESAPTEKNLSYSDESRRFAKALLELADKDKANFLKDCAEGVDFYQLLKLEGELDYDLTGFMYGWVVNAVRYVIGEKAQRNPALLEIRRR